MSPIEIWTKKGNVQKRIGILENNTDMFDFTDEVQHPLTYMVDAINHPDGMEATVVKFTGTKDDLGALKRGKPVTLPDEFLGEVTRTTPVRDVVKTEDGSSLHLLFRYVEHARPTQKIRHLRQRMP